MKKNISQKVMRPHFIRQFMELSNFEHVEERNRIGG
jgi:hypothetical protein